MLTETGQSIDFSYFENNNTRCLNGHFVISFRTLIFHFMSLCSSTLKTLKNQEEVVTNLSIHFFLFTTVASKNLNTKASGSAAFQCV